MARSFRELHRRFLMTFGKKWLTHSSRGSGQVSKCWKMISVIDGIDAGVYGVGYKLFGGQCQ